MQQLLSPSNTGDRWFAFGLLGSLFSFVIANATVALYTLLAVMVIDVLTGVAVAWQGKEIRSSKLRDGLAKKLISLLLVILAAVLEPQFTSLLPFPFDLSDAAAYAFTLAELVSIVENAARGGVNVPQGLLDILRIAQEKPKETKE